MWSEREGVINYSPSTVIANALLVGWLVSVSLLSQMTIGSVGDDRECRWRSHALGKVQPHSSTEPLGSWFWGSFRGWKLKSEFSWVLGPSSVHCLVSFFQLNHSHQHSNALNSNFKRNLLSPHSTSYHSILYFPLFIVSQRVVYTNWSPFSQCSHPTPIWLPNSDTHFAKSNGHVLVLILPDISEVFDSVTPPTSSSNFSPVLAITLSP